MSKLIRKTKTKLAKMERGQVLLLVAFAIVGIVAIIGLTLDVGVMFMEDARLRRAVDAAALAASLQYRQGIPTTQLEDAATEFLLVNGVTLDVHHPVTVDTCTSVRSMCDDPVLGYVDRKLVRVRVTATVHLAFLPVIGINTATISAEATGESASLDLVLALDTSESMTFDAQKGDPLRDPTICNDDAKASAYTNTNDGMPGECHPFEEVKTAAVNFVDKLFFPYDRVAVVTFDKTATTWLSFDENCLTPPCTKDEIRNNITGVIKNLEVYVPGYTDGSGVKRQFVCPEGQPCLAYCTQANIDAFQCSPDYVKPPMHWIKPTDPGAVYFGFDCGSDGDGNQYAYGPPASDPSQCQTTNIGAGLKNAGNAFSPTSSTQKQTSLWVVVLLTDGAANAGTNTDNSATCPENTWDLYRADPNSPSGWADGVVCRDYSSETRHCADAAQLETCMKNGNGLAKPYYQAGRWDPLNYDADDFAHDMADWVGITQNAVIFSIGFTDKVNDYDYAGQKLLTYAAEKVGNGKYYKADAANLDSIFKQIGDKIATRLAH